MIPRDLDLIRELLLRFEKNDQSTPKGKTQEEVAYHVKQMKDAGLIEAEIVDKTEGGRRIPHVFFVDDITPAGHDFILAMKNDTHWNRIKGHFEKLAVPLSVELAVQFSKNISKNILGLEL